MGMGAGWGRSGVSMGDRYSVQENLLQWCLGIIVGIFGVFLKYAMLSNDRDR